MKPLLILCAVFCSVHCLAERKPRASVQKISTTTRRHPITDQKQISATVRVHIRGNYYGKLVGYFLVESEGQLYFGSIALKSTTSYGEEYSTLTKLYITAGKSPKLKEFWVGYYYSDGGADYLLSSKEKGVDDVKKWLQKASPLPKANVADGGTALLQ